MNTYEGLVTPALASVWGIFLLRQFFLTIPRDYEDVARLDGASEFTIFRKIILPLSKPALATLAIFAFMNSWKDFLWPLIVTNKDDMRTVKVGALRDVSLAARFQLAVSNGRRGCGDVADFIKTASSLRSNWAIIRRRSGVCCTPKSKPFTVNGLTTDPGCNVTLKNVTGTSRAKIMIRSN